MTDILNQKSKENLIAANRCIEGKKKLYNSAVSRFYYSVFLKVLSILEKIAPDYKQGVSHPEAINKLINSQKDNLNSSALESLQGIFFLRRSRILADYKHYKFDSKGLNSSVKNDYIYIMRLLNKIERGLK